MFDRQWPLPTNRQNSLLARRKLWLIPLLLILGCWLGGCQSLSASAPSPLVAPGETIAVGKLREVAPPRPIQALAAHFNQYQPQVEILSPAPDAVVNQTTVPVKLGVKDLPLSSDDAIPLRPHLHLILDNQPYRAIYTLDGAIALEDLEPGTHTLRVFPVRPWHESYKNDGAYAQTTFHVLTKTDSNNPDPDLPLLTYSRPKGDYGAEPILLDYYLANAPLHIAAASDQTLTDWRIRVTINNESFLVDQWQPIYLKGFQPGENWVKLEFIDDQGNLIANRFNNTVRVINYQPGGEDALSRLMRGDVTLAEAFPLTGLTVPASLPDVEELVVEEPDDFVLPEETSLPATVNGSEDSETDVNADIAQPDTMEALPRPVAPPNPVELQASPPTDPPLMPADLSESAPLEERIEVLENMIKTEIPPAPTGNQGEESGQSLTEGA